MSKSTVDTSSVQAIGIDLGGTKIRAAIVENGSLVSRAVQVETPETPALILESLVNLIETLRTDRVTGVGIATAGVVNTLTGQVVGSTGNLPGWEGTRVKEIIESRVKLPVQVENDANAAAYCESKIEELRDKKCIVVITLGTGIGGGIIIDGNLYRGTVWGAGEIGHMRISLSEDRHCTCGARGCWEVYGCGRGLELTAKEMIEAEVGLNSGAGAGSDSGSNSSSVSGSLSPLLGDDAVNTYDIFEACKNKDALAEKIVTRWHEHIAIGIANLNHILNPDCYVITGGLSKFCNLELLKELVKERTMHNFAEGLEIRSAAKGNDAGLIGAAQCLIDSLGAGSQNKAPLNSPVV